MSKDDDEPDWDYREFRDMALEYGHRRNLRNASQISRAMGEKTDSKVSRWFRGEARPVPAGVKQISDATGAPFGPMMRFSGNDPHGVFATEEEQEPQQQMPAVVGEITTMFLPASPLSEQSRSDLERDLERVAEAFRREMRSRRKPA